MVRLVPRTSRNAPSLFSTAPPPPPPKVAVAAEVSTGTAFEIETLDDLTRVYPLGATMPFMQLVNDWQLPLQSRILRFQRWELLAWPYYHSVVNAGNLVQLAPPMIYGKNPKINWQQWPKVFLPEDKTAWKSCVWKMCWNRKVPVMTPERADR